MNSINDCYTLENGTKIPCLGFGTYNAKGGDNLEIIKTAIEAGYRYFDTASFYETERVLGQAIRESGIPREEFFIATKAWIDERGYDEVKAAMDRSLERLQMDYVDMYLIHWPKASLEEADWKERDVLTWRGMEEMHEAGKAKGLGLSNFLPNHLDVILENAKIKPQVDQLESHPGYSQEAAVAYGQSKGIRMQAWSPLGRGKMIENEVLIRFAEKYGKTPAQICLRFSIQKGIIPLVKSSTMERMKQNMDVFDFEISTEDIQILSCMPQNVWSGEHPEFKIPAKKSNFNQ